MLPAEKKRSEGRRPRQSDRGSHTGRLSEDKSDINIEPVYRKLAPSTKKPYDRMMAVLYTYVPTPRSHTKERAPICCRYEKRFLDSDPRNMETMKHFVEAFARATKFKLGKKLKRPTVKSIRVKTRSFMSAWERETKLPTPKEVHDSMYPVSMSRLRPRRGIDS